MNDRQIARADSDFLYTRLEYLQAQGVNCTVEYAAIVAELQRRGEW